MSHKKQIYYQFQFLDITTHSSTPHTVSLGFESNELILRTTKGDEILSLIIDYKYHRLKEVLQSTNNDP